MWVVKQPYWDDSWLLTRSIHSLLTILSITKKQFSLKFSNNSEAFAPWRNIFSSNTRCYQYKIVEESFAAFALRTTSRFSVFWKDRHINNEEKLVTIVILNQQMNKHTIALYHSIALYHTTENMRHITNDLLPLPRD